jgi:hypothetical protein
MQQAAKPVPQSPQFDPTVPLPPSCKWQSQGYPSNAKPMQQVWYAVPHVPQLDDLTI